MISPKDLHNHHHADDLLEDFVFGTLPAEDAAWMQAHLETCARCREESASLLAAMQALHFAAPEPGVQMSDDLWNRIERSISGPKEETSNGAFIPLSMPSNVTRMPAARTPMTPRQWLMVAALMLLSLLGGTLLGQVLPRLNSDEVEGQQIAIEFTDPNITATGELRYLPDEQIFVLQIDDMPAPPEGYVYQAWLIDGDTPIPVGVMNPELGELASVGNREEFQTFAITVEAGPLGNEAPTSDPIMVAPLQTNNGS